MDKWTSRGGNSERREEKRREEKRREEERIREEKEWEERICGSGGLKSRLAKAAGAEPSGQMRDEKLHGVVARSTFRSQNVQSTPFSEDVELLKKCKLLWREAHLEVAQSKKRTPLCGAKHISKSKCTKHTRFGPLLEVEMSKKCTPSWREAHFEVKSWKNWGGSKHFWTFGCRFAWQAQGILHLAKSESKTWRFCSSFKSVGRRGTFEEDLERCISRGRRGTRDAWGRCVRRSGRRFPEKCCILEHEIFRFAKMILSDRCNTSNDLSSLFRGRRNRSPYLILATGHALLLTLKLPLSNEFI